MKLKFMAKKAFDNVAVHIRFFMVTCWPVCFRSCLAWDCRLVWRHLSKAFLARSGNCLTRSLSGVSRVSVTGDRYWDFMASSQPSHSRMVRATSLSK